MGKLTIQGKAYREVEYNAMCLKICFTTYKDGVAEAIESVMNQSEDFLKVLQSEGISIDDIEMSDNCTEHERDYDSESKRYASREFKMSMPVNAAFINHIMDIISNNGYEVDFGITYYNTNIQEIRKSLLQEALEDSKRNAEAIAESMGTKIKGIETLQYNNYADGVHYLREGNDRDFLSDVTRCFVADNLKSPTKIEKESVEVVWIVE